MIIRKAKLSDLKNIMSMYESCVKGMIDSDIDQWDTTYPNSNIIKEDINAKTYFIAIKKNKLIGGINIDSNQDKTYLTINWEDTSNLFLVVHRLAVRKEFWGEGVGKSLMIYAEKLVINKNLKSIRLDTYSGNPKAIKFYNLLGYKKLGEIDLKPNKNKYYCFEKKII